MSRIMRSLLKRVSQQTAVSTNPVLNEATTFFTGEVNKVMLSTEFQDYIRGEMRKQGRQINTLTQEEYDGYLKKVLKDIAQLYS